MILRFTLFFLALSLLLGLTSTYVHRKTAAMLGLERRGRLALAVVFSAALALTVAVRLLARWIPAPILKPAGMLGATITLALLIAAVLLALVDLVGLALLKARRLVRRSEALPLPTQASTAPSALSAESAESAPVPQDAPFVPVPRREFLAQATTGSALLIGTSSSVYGALFGRHDYILEEIPVRIPGLSPKLDGYTIVQLSDVHLGVFVGEPELRAAEDQVRKARPDLIVLTGDLIDYDPRYVDLLGRFVERIAPLARDGVAAVPGNHDHYTGLSAVNAALARAKARVLANSGRVMGSAGSAFALLGVDDAWGKRIDPEAQGPDLDRALATVPDDLPRILLCHNPSYFTEAADRIALQLSGHTHGGQVNLLVRPADWVLPYPYIAGRYRLRGAQIYVNRGFGTAGPPARVGSPPEVSRIILVSA